MISEVIREYVETKLNDNTVSKRFVLGMYAYLEDQENDFIYTVKNGYTLIETSFIPCMMTFNISYQPIQFLLQLLSMY